MNLTRSYYRVSTFLVLLCLVVGAGSTCQASNKVVSVEEHWELKVSQPDADRSAPQITMVMSPKNGLDGEHILLTLNHATDPDYAAGGIQLQVWDGEEHVESHSEQDGEALNHDDETITWVQRVSLNDGQLTFQIVNGQSESWGSFGGDSLSHSMSTTLGNLNSYRPGVSISESQVSYAENRVVSLVLTKLVWVTEDGEVHEQNAPIPVDTSLDE